MNQKLPTKTLIPHSFGYFSAALFINSFKNQFSLTRNLFFLILLFGIVPNLMYSQGATCGTATSVAINGACLNGTISNTVTSGPASSCGTAVREGWYTFTVTGGPLTINIQAKADRDLAFQLISSTSSCTGLAVNSCINAVGDQGAAFGTESFTGILPNGIYYIKILNVGLANNMILQSLCVKSCTVINNNTVTYSNGTSGLLNATAAENGNAVLSAPPAGTYFAAVNFASYGTPAGTAPNFTYGTCHATTSQSVTEGYVLGSALSTSVPATNTVFGDPCSGTVKRLNIVASYAQPVCSGGIVNIAGATPTGGNGAYTYAWESSTTSATTGFGAAAGTNNGVSYTSGTLTQDTWFRRTVSSCNSTSTSAIVLVKINPKPTITNVSTATTCSGTSPNIILTSSVPSSFTWTVGTITGSITGANAGNGTAINQVLTNPSNSASGSVQYIVTPTATTGGCIGSPFTITVTVNPKPAVTNVATAATCSGTSPNIVLTSSSPSSFAWTLGTITGFVTGASAGNGTAINQVLTNPSNSASGSVQYIVTPTATPGGCIGSPFTITVTVNPIPSATIVSGSATFCGSTTIMATGGSGGTIYFQGTTSGGTSTTTASSSQTVNASGTYYFRSRSALGCWGSEGSVTVTKDADPSGLAANTITINSTQLTWTGAGNYIVEYGATGFTPGIAGSAGTGGTIASSNATSPYSLTGLLSNTNYDVYVRRINCPSTGFFGVNSTKVSFKTLAVCTAPTAQPTALSLIGASTTQVNGTFTAASPVASGYLVIRSTSATLSGNPVDGTTYVAGNALGGGVVVSAGTGTAFSDTGLTVSTAYHYFIMSYNNTSCVGGPKYLITNPLKGTGATLCPTATALSASQIAQTSARISWTGTGTYIIEYGVAGFTPGTGGTAGTGGTIATSSGTSPYNLSGLTPTTNYRVYIRQVCVLGGYSANSAALSFSTLCRPTTTTPTNTYITDVRFLGTLNDVENNSNGFSTGYQDFTGLANKTKQAAGEGVNVFVKSNDVDVGFRAWIDWNKDGIYTNSGSELVFNSGGTRAISTTFGVVIPAGTVPGDYTIRIRDYRYACADASGFCSGTFDACQDFSGTNYGEAEDYIITVLSNCAANLSTVTNAVNCGPGALVLSGKGNAGTSTLRWYNAVTGGSLLAETAVDGLLNASFTTPLLTSTTTYYVTAFNGTCESIFRRPVVARIRPIPSISFDLPIANANFCGENNTLKLNSSGDLEEIYLIEENFDSGLGVFSVSKGALDNSTVADTQWQNKGSIYTPVGSIWKPAISSGFGGNKFAFATSDYGTRTIDSRLTSTISYDTTGFANLKLTFSAFYSYYGDTSPAAGGTVEGLFVEVSTDGGTAWTPVKTYDYSVGIGTLFSQQTIDLGAYKNIPNLKIRFRYLAYWGDGLAIDNIKLYGDKPLTTSFVWTAPNIGIYQSNCVDPYVDGTPTSSVCLRPTDTQLQTIANWNISAIATLSNGCTSTGVISVRNDNKVWDTTASTVWGATDKWLPTNEIPDIDKCVIVKKPVSLLNTDGFARNIKILPGGSLTIKKDRTLNVADYIKNETTPLASNESNFVLDTDANLIQLNSVVANSGRMTAQRNITGLRYSPGSAVDYVYWSSPVTGQKTKGAGGFSPGTPNNRFFQYRESNDRFYETADLTFTPGKGYAVQAESNVGSAPTDRLFEFKGAPNNGDIGIALLKSPNGADGTVHGYNLVGNPYPSNINFEQLHYGNSGLIWGSAWFWTNNIFTATQMGSEYTGNNYAIWNGAGGVAATSPYNGGKIPNGIVKVGQAFIVQAKSAGNLNFKNKYDDTHVLRVNTSGDFYSKNTQPKNRFWINLRSPSQLTNSQLIAYVAGATDEYEQDYDAEAFGNFSDAFYSILPGKKLLIQGRNEAFSNEDEVPVGANFFHNGTYTIALEKGEGIFETNQNIYLKDKQEGIITNLTQGSYTFTAIKADNASRFEIIYQPEAVLATGGSVKEHIIVYRKATDFVIKSPKTISTVEVYDSSGKMVVVLKPNGTTAILDASSMPNGGYILKIKTKDGEVTNRKIIK